MSKDKTIAKVTSALLAEDLEKYGDYPKALVAAGAVIHAHERFGTYEGTWCAHVTYGQSTGWVMSYFGSCSGCDAFEAEFGYEDREDIEKLAAFGEGYLGGLLTQEQAEERASENISWDSDAQAMLDFIKAQA